MDKSFILKTINAWTAYDCTIYYFDFNILKISPQSTKNGIICVFQFLLHTIFVTFCFRSRFFNKIKNPIFLKYIVIVIGTKIIVVPIVPTVV